MNTPPTISSSPSPIGVDGYFSLVLSNLVLLASFGIFWLRDVRYVYRVANLAVTEVPKRDTILVFGLRLENNCAGEDFIKRLDRAALLYRSGVGSRIVILGGITGNNSISEAECGKRYLVDKKALPTRIIALEDASRHTLENLVNAKKSLRHVNQDQCILISNRYHLARSHVIAQGLKINHLLCPAEDKFRLNRQNIKSVLFEAYLIHWYRVGKAWSTLTQNKKSLNRIT